MITGQPPLMRLAIRAEGDIVNAYMAQNGTMDGAIFLGSIHKGVAQNPVRWDSFKILMMGAAADLTESVLGTRVTFGEVVTAPEHERAGHG